jgi:hypothetical protein
VSLDRIAALIRNSRKRPADAERLIAEADMVAESSQPEVTHPKHEGMGVVVGVTRDGHLEVTFGGNPWAVALPLDSVRGVDW